MFDKLITLIQQFIKELLPTFIIDEWEEGIVLRNGKYIKTVKPGLNFVNPCTDKLQLVDCKVNVIDCPR